MAIRVVLNGAVPAAAGCVQLFDRGESWCFHGGTVTVRDEDLVIIAEFDQRAVAFVERLQDKEDDPING